MTPEKPETRPSPDLFRNRLENLLNHRHELYRLADLIDWSTFEAEFGQLYCPDNGCPAKATRLMVGLQYLKHLYGLSDEAVVRRWVENPYWQYFCGATFFEHQLPIDPSSMTRFRQRIGTSGCELILQATVATGLTSKTIKPAHLKRITVDTTVQDKAVSFPTDSRLLNRSRIRLVKLSRQHGVVLRQSYARKGPQALFKANRYAHARQYRRMRGRVKKLRTYLGRVVRDIERKIANQAEKQAAFAEELGLAKRLLAQQKRDKNKLYSLHAPEVECISKGKAHKRYEFGVKASIATTNKSNFVVGGMALPGNPYDGHTLTRALDQVRRITGSVIDEAFVDRGYRGHGETQTTVYLSGQKRGVKTQRLKCSLKRREAIEPVIGHLKSDGLLGRNYLKGTQGDQMNVMLSCAGHNLRLILRKLRIFCLQIWDRLWVLLASASQHSAATSRNTPIAGIPWQPALNCGQFA
jgi:IS5 family transposase